MTRRQRPEWKSDLMETLAFIAVLVFVFVFIIGWMLIKEQLHPKEDIQEQNIPLSEIPYYESESRHEYNDVGVGELERMQFADNTYIYKV